MINIEEKLNSKDFISIIKIYINNPFLNLFNCIKLYKDGLADNSILIKYNEVLNKYECEYVSQKKDLVVINFTSLIKSEKNEELDFKQISKKYNNISGKKVLINNDPTDSQKEIFEKNNNIYISVFLNDKDKCYTLIKEYAFQTYNNKSQMATLQLLFIMIAIRFNYTIKEIPKIILYNDNINAILEEAFSLYFDIYTLFFKKILKLQNIIDIDECENIEELSTLNIDIDLNKIIEIKDKINKNEIPDFPYIYL